MAGQSTIGSGASRRIGLALATLGAVAFSGKAVLVKLAYRCGVDAVTVIMLRMLFALPLFLALSWWASRGQRPLTGRDRLAILTLGFFGYYLSSFLDFAGLQYINASLERLVLYLTPTIVLAIGALFFGRRVTAMQAIAMSVSYTGLLFVFGRDVSLQGGHAALGALLVFLSAISYAIYLVRSGEEVKRLGPLRLTGLATSVACLLCIAQFVILRPVSEFSVPPAVLWLSALNATLCTFAPVIMVMLAIDRIGATLAAQAGAIGPLSTIVLAGVFLGERLTYWLAVGTVFVVAGIWLLARESRRAASRH